MSKIRERAVIAVLLTLAVVGCSDEQKPDVVKSAADEVVVSVDNRILTRSQLNSRADMMLKLRQLQNPSMKVIEINRIRRSLVDTYPDFFIEHAIWANYAEAEKIGVDKKILERMRARAVMSVTGGKRKMKFSGLRSQFGELAPVLDEHVQMMAVSASAKKHVTDLNPTNIPPEFAAEAVQKMKDYNARMALTNALVYARATNCWEKLKSGENFVDMVQLYSDLDQEKKDNGEWGTLDLQQLEPDEQLHEFVKQHQVGEFSPPLEGDNGLMIIRIDDRKDAEYTLSRIFFQLPMFADVMTEKQVVKQELDKYNNRLIERKYKELRKSAKIVKVKAKKSEAKAKKAVSSGKAKKAGRKGRKGAKAKKAEVKPLTPEEQKLLEERRQAEEKLKESMKVEVFSGARQSAPAAGEAKISK